MNYSLSIRLCTDGFSFLVYSLGSGQLLLQESLPCAEGETLADALERGLQLPRIAGRHYERVVLYSTSPSTRVPLDEFRREDMLAVYRLTFVGTSPRPEDMCFQVLPSLDVVEIFTLPYSVAETLKSHYPSAMVQGLYGTMLSQVAEMQQGSTLSVSAHAIMLDGGVMIAVLRKGRLHFANVFRAAGNADKLYFILYAWKTLSLDAWHDSCTLYAASEDLYNELCQYLAHVEMKELSV
ncbi:MAG: DUF3822 family protein [Bacteroidaceae bacterium]|nr:DUF3822 family protein [Bacteroidaceae bacterium]